MPLFGNVGRLAEQKGVEIMLGALEEMLGPEAAVCRGRQWVAGIRAGLPGACA